MRPNSPKRWLNKWGRNLHRWGAIATLVPFLLVIVTGLLLLLKKDIDWIQPPTADAPQGAPVVALDDILAAAATAPEAQIASWEDINRIDIRPSEGIAKVRAHNGYEVQVSTVTGKTLQTSYRRSDLIESLHDGSFFHESAKLLIFLPSALIVLGLWLTGTWLWLMPHLRPKRR